MNLTWYTHKICYFVQEKVREEILTVYPEECAVDSSKLPYLMAVICETQRVRSIVPVGIPHGCIQVRTNNLYRRLRNLRPDSESLNRYLRHELVWIRIFLVKILS